MSSALQEEVDEKTIALVISGGRITANILKSALAKVVQEVEEANRIKKAERKEIQKEAQAKRAAKKEAKKNVYKPGKKSLNSLMEDGSELTNIEITNNNIKSFEKVARKYGIQYSLKKDKATTPPTYLVFFRAKHNDVMTAAFKEYSNVALPETRKASIRKRLRKAIERSVNHREREKVHEKNREPTL